MTLFQKVMLFAAGTGLVALAVKDHDRRVAREALWQQRDSTAAARIDSLERRTDSLKAAYRRDTVRLTKWLTKWDTAKGRVDSIPVDRPVPYEVVRTVIVTADSTIAACRSALSTCETEKAALRATIGQWEGRFRDLKQREPGFLRRHLSFGPGYGVMRGSGGVVRSGPTVALQWRIWP